jgi:hypothetical protein
MASEVPSPDPTGIVATPAVRKFSLFPGLYALFAPAQ